MGKKSLMILLIGVSGSGKSTLRNYATDINKNINRLLAVTDRPIRKNEENGKDKFFFSENEFNSRKSEFCLINELYQHNYAFFKKYFSSGKTYLGELHYTAINEFKQFHESTITIYIRVTDISLITSKIKLRDTNKNQIEERISALEKEMAELEKRIETFDYVFENNYDEKSKNDFLVLLEKILEEI